MAVSPSSIAEAIRWRRDFHACPELGYQEQKTSRRVAELLTSFGLQVHCGLAGTGVVATLENGPGPVIGLRADMDALPITERGDVSYKSRNPGGRRCESRCHIVGGDRERLRHVRRVAGRGHAVPQYVRRSGR